MSLYRSKVASIQAEEKYYFDMNVLKICLVHLDLSVDIVKELQMDFHLLVKISKNLLSSLANGYFV